MSNPPCIFDFETRSRCPLKTAGLARYARDPSTEVLCAAYILPGETTPKLWLPNDPIPDFTKHTLAAWNSAFEKEIWTHVLKWPMPADWYCIAAHARFAGLPGALQAASEWFNLGDKGKDAEGHAIMLELSQPAKTGNKKIGRVKGDWITDPAKSQKLHEYCLKDCIAEKTILDRLPAWPEIEQDIWRMTAAQNERGCPVDIELCKAVVSLTEQFLTYAQDLTIKATGGEIISPTQNVAIVKWLNEQGVNVENCNKDTVAQLLTDESLSYNIKAVLKARQIGAPASVKKFRSALEKEVNGRLYHQFVYCGGGATGRWSGGGGTEDEDSAQLQNMKRGSQFEAVLDVIKLIDMNALTELSDAIGGGPIKALQDSVRSMLYSAI